MPLASSFVLSKKKGKEAWVEPVVEGSTLRFEVRNSPYPKTAESGTKFCNEKNKTKYATFTYPVCQLDIAGS